ncbi:fluoroquinolone resistance protein [Acidiphilium sp. MT5]
MTETEFTAARPPKRYTALQFNAWRARWASIDPEDALKAPPFGKTEDGLLDFRGFRLCRPEARRKAILNRTLLRGCDFTAAILAETISEHAVIENCIFDYTDMNEFGDYGSNFTNCRFFRCEWQAGAIGYDTNKSQRGEYQSRYMNCHFENVKLTKTSIGDPHFFGCSFIFKKLSGIDFGCSFFVNCRFEGAFQDLTFRGKYHDEHDTARKGDPQFVGFLDVSFEKAALQWFTLRDGFPVRSTKMPNDGSAFIADLRKLCQDQHALANRLPDQRSRAVMADYLDIECGVAERQPLGIVSRYDLFESFDKGEEALIPPAYDLLKQSYAVTL